jgi:predicted metal-dependent peptidase
MAATARVTRVEPAAAQAPEDSRTPTAPEGARLAAARLWATGRFPYFSTALFTIRLVRRPGLGTFAIDRSWRMSYDPAVLDRWTTAEVGAVLVHEVLHVLRDHAGRGEDAGLGPDDALLWNVACDAEINDDLVDAGIDLPGDPILPASLGAADGQLAETYLDLIRAWPRPVPEQDCGSGAHGRPSDTEEDGSAPEGVDPIEGALVRRLTAEEVRTAARSGTVPAGINRWAESVGRSTVDWRRELGAVIRRGAASVAGQVDYSFGRRRRSGTTTGVILPGLTRPVPEVAVVCDTSASMDRRQLAACLTEVDGIIARLGLRARRVTVLAVDDSVQEVGRVGRADQVILTGGGGTEMGLGIEAAVRLRPRPHLVVVLTDGWTGWPKHPPRGTRVVVGLLADGAPVESVPGWARCVPIGADG